MAPPWLLVTREGSCAHGYSVNTVCQRNGQSSHDTVTCLFMTWAGLAAAHWVNDCASNVGMIATMRIVMLMRHDCLLRPYCRSSRHEFESLRAIEAIQIPHATITTPAINT